MSRKPLSTRTLHRLLVGSLLCLSTLLVPVVLAACDIGGGSGGAGSGPARSGEVVFQRYCNVCHPGGGFGAGPSLIVELPRMSDEQVREVVRHGKNRMPGFTQQEITDEELANLIVYMRGLE